MPPQEQQKTWVVRETDAVNEDSDVTNRLAPTAEKRVWKIVWRNVLLMGFAHIGGVYGLYLFLFKSMWLTNFFAVFLYLCSGLGITAGAHRLWSHKSYKAKLPLRILLTIFNTIAFQDAVLDWSRDHRMHHKYSETDADPHNATFKPRRSRIPCIYVSGALLPALIARQFKPKTVLFPAKLLGNKSW